MLITGKQIEQYVTLSEFTKINQVGIDLSVSKIEKIKGGIMVLQDKTIVSPDSFHEVSTINVDGHDVWRLEPGSYALTFNEGIEIPADKTAFILSRSSIYRGGSMVTSPIWDPGFKTKVMGTTMFVTEMIMIEKNARVGQLFMH